MNDSTSSSSGEAVARTSSPDTNVSPAPFRRAVERAPASGSESLIAGDATIEGKIEGAGHVRIAGRFKGDINVQGNVTIEAGAHVTGQVYAHTVIVSGELQGNIIASEVARDPSLRTVREQIDDELLDEVITKIRLEAFYINQMLPKIIEEQDPRLRNDFLVNSGLDRFQVEDLEAEYFELRNYPPHLLQLIREGEPVPETA